MITFLSQAMCTCMCISCFEDRQTIYPMVPEQWKVATTWVRGLEAAGVCKSERRQGNLRMGGWADRLEVAAKCHSSSSLACLPVDSDKLWEPPHHRPGTLCCRSTARPSPHWVVPCSLLGIQTTLGSALCSHSHPTGQYWEMEGLMSVGSFRLIAR